uniref:hypothetical protein n=1 Tax=Sphingomonas sp. TaxID=28214 RepID=UPI0025CC2BBB|nr:hypothetical protein [Sphingomonas sp.]
MKNIALPIRRSIAGLSSREGETTRTPNSEQHAKADVSASDDSIDVSRPRTRRGLDDNPDQSKEPTPSSTAQVDKEIWTPQDPTETDRSRKRTSDAASNRILVPSTTIDNSSNRFQDMYANNLTDQDD